MGGEKKKKKMRLTLGGKFSRAYHLIEIWPDWLRARIRVGPIELGLGLVLFVSYTLCINHFLE